MGSQQCLGGRRAGTPYPPLHVMVPHHLNGVCGHSDQVRHLSGPAFSLSVDFFRPVGRRRATRCAPTVPSARKCYVVVFQSAVWCGSVTTLVADPSFTRPALKRCFSLVLPAPSPSGRPSARPPPAHPLPPNPGLFRNVELATGPSMGVAATAAVGLGARIAWAVPCVVRRGESGKGWIRGLFEKSSCRSKSAGSVHVCS